MRPFARRRRLRALQRAYYAGPERSEQAIADYLRVLAEAREDELRRTQRGAKRPVALHIGSGGHYIRRWINVDFLSAPPVDISADASAALPFRSESVDYIHSEDFIEHVDLAGGKRFVAEAYRVLRAGGIMRLLTPDLRALIRRVYDDRETKHLAWCKSYFGTDDACESLNMHLRMNGEHRFVYDEECLRRVLHNAGFAVRLVRWNASRDPWLRYLDLRDFGLNLFVECTKEPVHILPNGRR